jgi:hypothetical protein
MASNLTQKQLAQIRHYWKLDVHTLEAVMASGAVEKYKPRGRVIVEYQKKRPSRDIPHVVNNKPRPLSTVMAASFAEKLAKKFRKLLCQDLRYCERSKSEGLALAISIADSLVMLTVIPVPVTAISVYLVRRGILDRVCKCAKRKRTKA